MDTNNMEQGKRKKYNYFVNKQLTQFNNSLEILDIKQ